MKNLKALLIPRMPIAASADQICGFLGDRLRGLDPGDRRVDTLPVTTKVPTRVRLYTNENNEFFLDNTSVNYPPDYYFIWFTKSTKRRANVYTG